MKRWLCILFLTLGCKSPQVEKSDPYTKARNIISQSTSVVSIAEGVFSQWLISQKDPIKIAKATDTYSKAKTGVANGIRLAYEAVNLAESVHKNPDMEKVGKYANAAWSDLYTLLSGLVSEKGVPIALAGPATLPSSSSGNIGKSTSAITISEPLAVLPKILIQGKSL